MSRPPLPPAFDLAGSFMATFMRAGMGVVTPAATIRPPALFELYEYEGCPDCRLVREALTELDLDALIYPVPRAGERFRPRVLAQGGKARLPFLVDPNTGRSLFEATDIVRYLFETYAGTPSPLHWRFTELQKLGSTFAGMVRLGAGQRARASRAPAEPLELYSFEASPYARPVRECLSELEIPYVLRSTGRRSAADWVPPDVRAWCSLEAPAGTLNRRLLRERAGRVTIPYLVDPNTATALGESTDIVRYLEHTYAA